VIDHIGFEVSDLGRSAAFYDPVFHALGARRMHDAPQAIAYGINGPTVWFVSRGLGPGATYGHLALSASGKAAVDAAYAAGLAHGGAVTAPESPPGQRPQYGRRYYAAYLTDPDGLRVEIVSRR
jgi:catechol 2,3-dioxygenase-like lactoylglutathione lyase family enzyme